MTKTDLSNLKNGSLYVFELHNTSFIGKLLYVRDDEIAVEDILNCSNRFFSRSCMCAAYLYNPINLIGIPFAYNGPAATITGAGMIFNGAKLEYHDYLSATLLKHDINQSSSQYLDNLLDYFLSVNVSNSIFVGGNHLSALPLHRLAQKDNLCSIIFDAHRDYQVKFQDQDLSHANFLNCLDDLSSVIIFGYRDGKIETFRNCKSYNPKQEYPFLKQINEMKRKGFKFYVDIDIDVLDPYYFPATGCPIKDGLSPQELYKIIKYIGFESIKYVSIEEYLPYLGDEHCKEIIYDTIKLFIKGWNGCE